MTTPTFYIAAAYVITIVLLGCLLLHVWYRGRALKPFDDDHGDSQ